MMPNDLPRRVFLDTSIVDYFCMYSNIILDGEALPSDSQIFRMGDLRDDVSALNQIVLMHQRNTIELAASPSDVHMILGGTDFRQLEWISDSERSWQPSRDHADPGTARGEREGATPLQQKIYGYLSKAHKLRLGQALALECDAFLSVDPRLTRNAAHLEKTLNLMVAQPSAFVRRIKRCFSLQGWTPQTAQQ